MKHGGLVRLILLGFLLVLIIGGVLLGGASQPIERTGSAFSAENGGRRAAYRLLGALGFDSRGWTKEPGRLGVERVAEGSMLLLADVPPPPMVIGTRADPEGAEASSGRGLRDQRHYLRYIEEGGTIVVHAEPELLEFFGETLELTPLVRLREEQEPEEESEQEPEEEPEEEEESEGLEAQTAFLATGEAFELNWPLWPRPDAAWAETRGMSFEILLADEEDRPIAFVLEIERGQLVLMSSQVDPFRNAAIAEGEAALLLVRMVESFAPIGPVYFDEYALGLWAPKSPLELALAPKSLLFTVHLALFALLLFWRAVWVGPFIRDPEVFENISPLARARGFAGILARRGRWDLLATFLRRGIMRRLAQRAGLRGEEAEFAEEIRAVDVDKVLSVLAPRAGVGSEANEKARSLLLDEPPRDRQAFERVGYELALLERVLVATSRRASKDRTSAR